MADNKMKDMFTQLDALLSQADIKDVTADSSGFTQLPDGYYLCEVKEADIKMNKAGTNPQAVFQLKIVEDGINPTFDSKDNATLNVVKKTSGRMIFKYYPFTDERSIKNFVADMLKFEGDTPGEPILTKDYFTNSELVEDAIDILKGMRIYAHIATSEKDDGSKNAWTNLISWKTARSLSLPE